MHAMKEVIVKMVFVIFVIGVRYFIYVVLFYELYIEKGLSFLCGNFIKLVGKT